MPAPGAGNTPLHFTALRNAATQIIKHKPRNPVMKKKIVYGIEVIGPEGYMEEYRCVSGVGCKKVAEGFLN